MKGYPYRLVSITNSSGVKTLLPPILEDKLDKCDGCKEPTQIFHMTLRILKSLKTNTTIPKLCGVCCSIYQQALKKTSKKPAKRSENEPRNGV